MLGTRLTIGLSMASAFVLVLWLDEALGLAPWYPFWFLTVLLGLGLSSQEIVELLKETSARPSGNTVLGGVMVLAVANWAPHIQRYLHHANNATIPLVHDPSLPIDVMAWPFWVFTAVIMYTFVSQSAQFDKPGGTMANIGGTVLAVAYIGLLGSYIIQLRMLNHGLIALAALVATAKGADTGAYTMGRIAGRHKFWPRLSPNKTVEGALGGMVFGVVGALALVAFARLVLRIPSLSWPAAIGFGLIVGAAAQLGDLMESMIKRDCLRKDASAIVPGFGGVLDVLDSLLFAGPIAYGYWICFTP